MSGLSQALATLDKLEQVSFQTMRVSLAACRQPGERLQQRVPIKVTESYPALSSEFEHPEADALRALFTTLMFSMGFLHLPGVIPRLRIRKKSWMNSVLRSGSCFAKLPKP